MTGTASAVALVGQDDDTIRSLPAIQVPQRAPIALPGPEEVKALQAYGEVIAASKLFKNVTTWQGAVMVARYGQQLGIDEFTALTQVYWIEGTPTASAGLINSLITRDHGGEALLPVESTAKRCTISYKRREWTERKEATLGIEDVPAILKKKDNWINYPTDMLWARLVSRIGRQSFADTIKGLYTREEIEDSQATEATYRLLAAAPAPPVPAPLPSAEQSPAPAPATPPEAVASVSLSDAARRKAEANALTDAIIAAFAVDKAKAKEIGQDLICWRYGYTTTAQATNDQLADVRAAVDGWGTASAADMHKALSLVGGAANESMATDAAIVLEENGVDDGFIAAALSDALARFEEEASRQMSGVDRNVDRAVAP